MDVVEPDGGKPTAWVTALTEWIGRDARPRFIINPDLDCLWRNDAANRLLGENDRPVGEPVPRTLRFFDQHRLKSLLEEAEDDQVHWGVVPDRNGENLIVWARAIGDAGGDRLFGLVLMPPHREQNFREFFENARLTPAETRIIDAILRGESLGSTATLSGVSKETIKTQLKNAYRKLGVSSRSELFAEAHRFLAP